MNQNINNAMRLKTLHQSIKEARVVKITGHKGLDNFLAEFPDNATNWSDATEEIREIAYIMRQIYNEMQLDVIEGDEGYVESIVDDKKIKKPSGWNQEFKRQIKTMWNMMDKNVQKYAMEEILELYPSIK